MPENRPSFWIRFFVFVLVSAGVAAAGWWFWKRQQQATTAGGIAGAKGAVLVTTAKVRRENYAYELEAIGTVRAYETTEITSNVTETITALHFNDGDQVKKGQLLAILSDAEEQALLASAQAQLAEEEREIARLQGLVKEGAAPEARLEERKTLATIAGQKIREAEAKLADRRILAPFDGWLGLRRISVGALVSPGTVIASLDKFDVVKIDFTIPETVLGSLKPGTQIAAANDAMRDRKFEGKLAHLDSRIDPITRSIAARAEVPNPDLALRPGMLVMVNLSLEPRISLSVPERAVVPLGTRKFLFLIDPAGGQTRAKRVEIRTGRRKPGFVEVLSGVQENQTVIADGLVGLQDGAPVKVTGEFKAPVPAFNPEQTNDLSP